MGQRIFADPPECDLRIDNNCASLPVVVTRRTCEEKVYKAVTCVRMDSYLVQNDTQMLVPDERAYFVEFAQMPAVGPLTLTHCLADGSGCLTPFITG